MQTNDMQMESSKCEEPPKSIMVAEAELKNENLDDQQQEKLNKSNGLEVAIMLPPPPVLVNLIATLQGGDSNSSSRPPSSLAAAINGNGTDKNEEEEVLSLQVLSARSSTPYTVQGICCANANCAALEATTDSSNASQWKEENHTQLVTEVVKEDDHHVDENGNVEKQHNHMMNGHSDERKKYSRSDLLDIRDEMTIIRPECLESARLQRLHFRKSENGSFNGSGIGRNKSYRNSNPPNDLMPAFFKRKAVSSNGNNSNSIVYDNFKYNDSNPFSNHSDSGSFSSSNYRRIGSGRISSVRETNWDYIPEEDPDRHNLPEFFNTKDSIGTIQPKPQRPHRKHELDDNSNYVKRVISAVNGGGGGESFRLSGSRHSINSSGEERYNSTASSSNNNKSDEPEWFSCGPTSRLDTIELCGFNESDQQKIRMEMSKNKPDSNNNRHDFTHGQQHNNNKEKKHLAFQFDDFSSSHNNKPSGNGSGAHVGTRMPSSKFMPLFNAKKKDEEAMTNHTSTQLLNEIFKRNDIPAAKTTAIQTEKLSTTEMPSVDEIEAKWRTNIPTNNDSRGKPPPSSENFNNSSENFKKMLNQLNQQQQQHGAGVGGSMSSPPPQQLHSQSNTTSSNNNNQQTPMNLFNNENLSNFIKHRSLQQQILQKQQQQAAFAQLQFNAILSRPDTQMLLLSLARGEISKHGLVVQLANPNLTQADREAISAALTFSAAGQYHHQMAINSNQQQFIANQLQNLALMTQMNKSPVSRRNANGGGNSGGGGGSSYQSNNGPVGGSGNGSPRTYTQEELQSHANFILHNAMLKKKLEEQNMGLQKMLHLQSSMMNGGAGGNLNNNSRNGGNDSMAGTKNFHNHNYHQQQKAPPHQQQNIHHQQQQQQQHHHQQRQRRGSNAGNRSNHPLGRRRSTSSSSTNTVNSGNMTVNSSQHSANMHLRRQLEQRRNTIATTTVGADDFVQIPQRI
ncbi:protein cup [Episyrphus balteatus]|uniref:protein cup n=1 Tax=Episyrphus balteatus TaxID=286459 RepID=UPI002486B7F0|nr:protein cup [Episyrphus balteatus]